MDGLMEAPAMRQARAVREREVFAAELVAAHVGRLDALQPKLRAMLHVRRQRSTNMSVSAKA